jgi:hypothetical protein
LWTTWAVLFQLTTSKILFFDMISRILTEEQKKVFKLVPTVLLVSSFLSLAVFFCSVLLF